METVHVARIFQKLNNKGADQTAFKVGSSLARQRNAI